MATSSGKQNSSFRHRRQQHLPRSQ